MANFYKVYTFYLCSVSHCNFTLYSSAYNIYNLLWAVSHKAISVYMQMYISMSICNLSF